MTEWGEARLEDLCDRITVGFVGKMSDQYLDDGVPFLRSQNIQPFRVEQEGVLFIGEEFHDRIKKSTLRAGDVAVVRTGYPGTAAVVPRDLDGSNCADLVIITPSSALNPHFLAAVFNSTWGKAHVGGQLVGAAQQHFNVGSAKAMNLRLPERTAQDRVAGVLCSLTGLIENNRRRIELLEEMAQVIYREWFVHFRFPGHEDATFVDSPLGPIPEGWEAGELQDYLVLQRGFDLPTKQRETGSVPIIGASGIQGTHSTAKVSGPGLCTGRSGTIGLVNYVATAFWPLNTALWVKEFRVATPLFGYFLLQSIDLKELAGGAAVPSLNRNHIHGLKLAVAPTDLVSAWNGKVEPIFELIDVLGTESHSLAAARDVLLPKLVTGEIDVSDLDLDALVEAAS